MEQTLHQQPSKDGVHAVEPSAIVQPDDDAGAAKDRDSACSDAHTASALPPEQLQNGTVTIHIAVDRSMEDIELRPREQQADEIDEPPEIAVQEKLLDPEDEPSIVQHHRDVYTHITDASPVPPREATELPASSTSIAAVPSPSASPISTSGESSSPSARVDLVSTDSKQSDWLSELRAQWTSSEKPAAAARHIFRPAYRPRLSPAVEASPPLQGDVVWNPLITRRKITMEEREDFLRESKLAQYRFHRMTRQIASMFYPTAILCVIIFIYSQALVKHSKNPLVAWNILLYKESPSDSTGTKVQGSLLNALEVLGAIISITFVFIFCYWRAWWRALRYFLICVILALLTPWIYFSLQFVRYYDVPVDYISFILFLTNFFAVGYIGLVCLAETPHTLNRAYLICLSLAVAWPFMEFTEWTVWTTIVVLTVYDLLAVLCPCGPLRWIMNQEAQKKAQGHVPKQGERLPGMMYVGEFFSLGLGDLIFYGALMGRAANEGLVPLVACAIGVLMGVAGTILWSYFTTAHAIPALPLSVLCGLSFYASTSLCILPMVQHAAVGGWQV